MKVKYQCEICHSTHNHESQAVECEGLCARHKAVRERLELARRRTPIGTDLGAAISRIMQLDRRHDLLTLVDALTGSEPDRAEVSNGNS